MLSTDRSALNADSAFRGRLKEYALHTDRLIVLVAAHHPATIEVDEKLQIMGCERHSKIAIFFELLQKARSLIADDPRAWLLSTQEEFTGLIGYMIKRSHGTKWQAQVHTDIGSPYYGHVFLKNRIRAFIAKRTLGFASCIRVVSERVRNNIQRYCSQIPMTIVPIYVDKERFRADLLRHNSPERFTVVMVGRLVKEKNISLALNVFSELLKKVPHAKLEIIGDGPEKKKLFHESRMLGLERAVSFRGNLKEVESILHEADVYMLTSWYEGYGMSVIEAMAAGCAVIMTEVGIAGEICIDGVSGLIVPPGGKKGLLGALLSLADDPSLRDRLGKGARKAIEKLPTRAEYMTEYHRSLKVCLNNP